MTIKGIEVDIGTAVGGRIPTALLILPSQQKRKLTVGCFQSLFARMRQFGKMSRTRLFSSPDFSTPVQSIEPWEIPFSYRRGLRYVTVSAHSGIGWAAVDKKDAGLGLVISYFARSRH